MGSEAPSEEYEPSLRQCLVVRPSQGSCGFHLSRTQWDPYPWVSEVEPGSAADKAGLVVGDCVLEVNNEDVLGLRIGAVALRVYARGDQVRLLVWNSGVEYNGAIWCSGNGPTPLSLQRLASCLQAVVSLLECPVCLETIPPPAFQCCNGHSLCSVCRALTDRCPVCRVALGPRGRCLLADKLHMLFTATFLQSGSKKQKRSKTWMRQAPNLQLPSRLMPRIVPTPTARPEAPSPFYNCPLESCDAVVKAADLMSHLQHHDGPLVQYFCKDSSTYLRFPVTRLTTLSLSHVTFVLHVTPHPTAGCLLLWLWAAVEDTSSYRIQLDFPGKVVVSGAVFPLSWTTRQVIDLAADKCVVLNDEDFDNNCTKVKITIVSKYDSTTI